MMSKKKVALVILDGWGYGAKDVSDAIHNAHTPCMDSLHKSFPHATLRTDGEYVGLPEGQMGNSEVGHMNIGASKLILSSITYQLYCEGVSINFKCQRDVRECFKYFQQHLCWYRNRSFIFSSHFELYCHSGLEVAG